ncbi:MAG: c-type cytochrome [Thermoanaerobaculia bacterium]
MRSSFLVVTLLFLAACGELKTPTNPGSGGEPIDPTATFTRVQNEIITPTCLNLGCHDPIGQSSSLVMQASVSYSNLVNRPSVEMPSLMRVAPNDPSNSYLYRKVTGAGITGDRMPLSKPPLTDAQLKLIRDWIRRGAPND